MLAANPGIAAGLSMNDVALLAELGGGHGSVGTDSQSSVGRVTAVLNHTDFAQPGMLAVEFYGASGNMAGVTGLDVDITADGSTLFDQDFSAGGAASLFGVTSPGLADLGPNGLLDLTVTVTAQTDQAAAGFHGHVIVGEEKAAGGMAHVDGACAMAVRGMEMLAHAR